jgi:DUF4097 and DUF4098 domain-containing protein YvlB
VPPETPGSSSRFVERESKSFPVSGAPRVTLRTFDGPVVVRSWDKSEVMYTAVKRAATEEAVRGIGVRAEQNGSNVTVVAELNKSLANRTEGIGDSDNAQVSLEVFLPRSSALSVNTGDGRLSVEGVSGDLDLRTGDGPIEVRDGRGRLSATTGDGRVRVSGFEGDADVKTGDGGITLEGRFGQLSARTGDGSITLALPADVNATIETDAEDVVNDGLALTEEPQQSKRLRRWRLGAGGPLYKLRTGDGRIFLRSGS